MLPKINGMLPTIGRMQKFDKSVDRPPIGFGLLYHLIVTRQGLGDALYIGVTSRPLGVRRKEHLENAKKLGVLFPGGGSGDKTRGYNLVKGTNGIHVLLRTALGLTGDNNPIDNYLETQYAYHTLHSLGNEEAKQIKQKRSELGSQSGLLNNYQGLKYQGLMNIGDGGEGIRWSDFSRVEIAVSAFYHLKYERGLRVKTTEDLLKHLYPLVYPNGGGSRSQVAFYLESYFKTQPIIEAALNGRPFRTLRQVKTQLDALFRPTGTADIGGFSGDKIREALKGVKIEYEDDTLLNIYNGKISRDGFQTKRGQKVDDVAAETIDHIVETVINTTYDNYIKFATEKRGKRK